jgi:predicted Zn-dependent peptidase
LRKTSLARQTELLSRARSQLARLSGTFRAGHLLNARDVQQATVVIGGTGCAWNSPDRYSLLLIHCVLGDGMSSRLFQNLRETHGLVYSIYSNPEFLSREGVFGIGFATDPSQVGRAMQEIGRELARLRIEGLTQQDLRRAKENIKGGILLGLESTGSRMAGLARRTLGNQWDETPHKILACIDAVTRTDILRCARQYLHGVSWASAAVIPNGFKLNLGRHLATME